MIRLEKLTIHNLGNVAPGTELQFGQRGSLLIGRNGSGKTTLLRIIAACLSSDWGVLIGLDRAPDIEFVLVVEPPGEAALRFDVTMKKTASSARNSGAFDLLDPTGDLFHTIRSGEDELVKIELEEGRLTWKRRDGSKAPSVGRIPPTLPAVLAAHDADGNHAFSNAATYARALDSLGYITRLDEALNAFDGMTDDYGGPPSLAQFTLDASAQVVSGRALYISDAMVRSFVAKEQSNSRSTTFSDASIGHIPFVDSSDPASWLADFCRLSELESVQLHLNLISASQRGAHTEALYGPLTLTYRTHGRLLGEHYLSFGQKRLFAALHYLDANRDIVVADELVNGMHHEWIRYCVNKLETRQAFLANQNPLLFDFWYFESVEDVATCFIDCRCDDAGRFLWRNISDINARHFYATYKGGIQHVSDILRTRGYW